MSKFLIILLASLLLAAGCATQTPYKPAAERGDEGYTETRLGESRYRITFVGNTQTDSETVKDYALLRAAELTLQKGYTWFQVVERETDKKNNSATTLSGGFGSAGHTSVYRDCGVLNCQTVVASSPGFSTGIGIGSTRTSSAYSYALEVLLGKPPMPKEANAYDARELSNSIRSVITGNASKP